MEDEEPLMERQPEVNFHRRGLMVAVLLALVAGASLALFPTVSEPKLRQRAGQQLPGEIVGKAKEGGFKTKNNTNFGNQAGRDVVVKNQTIIQKIYQVSPKDAPSSDCTVVKATPDKITFGGSSSGTFISYSDPEKFKGMFFKNWKRVTDVKDLPRCLTKLWLQDPDLGGDVSQLPRALRNVSLRGHSGLFRQVAGAQFKGKLMDLPPLLQYLDLKHTSSQLSGDIKDLPQSLVHLDLWVSEKVTGNLWDLPRHLHYVDFHSNKRIEGPLMGLPLSLTHADFAKSTKIVGDVKDLPNGLAYADFASAKSIWGKVKHFPSHLQRAYFWDSKGIKGDFSEVPNNLRCWRIGDDGGGGVECCDPQWSP